MIQIATKYVPQELQRYAKRSGMAQIVTKNATRPYPQTYKQGGNDANSDKICSSNPSQDTQRQRVYIHSATRLADTTEKCIHSAPRLTDTTTEMHECCHQACGYNVKMQTFCPQTCGYHVKMHSRCPQSTRASREGKHDTKSSWSQWASFN